MFVQHGCTNLGLSPNRPYQKAFGCQTAIACSRDCSSFVTADKFALCSLFVKTKNRGLDHVLGEQLRMCSSLVFTVLRN
jgi:hypothetical protein